MATNVTISYAENNTGTPRTGTVIFTGAEGSSATVTLSQESQYTIAVAGLTDDMHIDNTNLQHTVTATCNVNTTFDITSAGVTQVWQSTTPNSIVFDLTFPQNTAYYSKVYHVTIHALTLDISRTFKVVVKCDGEPIGPPIEL